MQNENSNKPLLGADNNALIALLSINLVVYALIGFFKVVYYLNSLPLEQFYAQIMQPSILASSPSEFLQQPWTLLTYYWVHDGFWAVLVIIGSFFRGPGFNFVFPWREGIFFEL